MQDYGLAKKATWRKIRMDYSKCYGKSKLKQYSRACIMYLEQLLELKNGILLLICEVRVN